MAQSTTTLLQGCIQRMRAGDQGAREELIKHSCERLRRLTQRMLGDYARLRRWADTDDVMNSGVVRLLRALEAVSPASVDEFFKLAAVQLRRELIDLARHYFGPQGPGRHEICLREQGSSADNHPPAAMHSTLEPTQFLDWCEFHEHVEALPAREREVFSLLWYHGLTQVEAAEVLNVSEPTVRRWWLSARLHLQEALNPVDPTS